MEGPSRSAIGRGSFDDLLKILAGETGQLVLPVEGGDSVVLSDPPSRPMPEVVQCFWKTFGTALFGAPSDAPQAGPARRPLSLLDAFH